MDCLKGIFLAQRHTSHIGLIPFFSTFAMYCQHPLYRDLHTDTDTSRSPYKLVFLEMYEHIFKWQKRSLGIGLVKIHHSESKHVAWHGFCRVLLPDLNRKYFFMSFASSPLLASQHTPFGDSIITSAGETLVRYLHFSRASKGGTSQCSDC